MTTTSKYVAPSLEIRCPKLGHQVNFHYCQQENNSLPCAKIVQCWQKYFDVETFLKQNFTPEELAQAFAPPKPKMLNLLELIERAKKLSSQE